MKIAIVGVGAMGSVYAGLLGDSDNEVWAVDPWRDHVDAINAHGLRLEGASGDRTVSLNATCDAGDVGVCDLVVIATKAMHVQEAARSALPMVDEKTVVLTIQNGLGSADKVAAILGEDRVAIGVVGGFGASMIGPGHAHHNGWELVRLGERNGTVTPRLEAVAAAWRSAGFRVRTFDDIHQMIWEKLICNVGYSALCTVTGWRVGEVLANEHAVHISAHCASEAFRVARAMGIKLEFDDAPQYVRAFGEKIPNARPSMLLDYLAGRPTEIDVINGAIPAAAAKVNMTAPVNDTLSAMVRAMEWAARSKIVSAD